MRFEFFLAIKHLFHRRKTGFVSLVSMISMGGVAVGVMALIVVLAVMSGFDRELKAKIVSVQPHLRVESMGGVAEPLQLIKRIRALNIPGVTNYAPYVEGQAMLKSDANASGVIVKGADPEREDLTIFQKNLLSGKLDLSDVSEEKMVRKKLVTKEKVVVQTGGLILGESLAARLGVRVGERIQVIVPVQEEDEVFSLKNVVSREFIVRGIFRLGMNDFDTGLVIVSFSQAEQMYKMNGRATGVSLKFNQVDDAEKTKWGLRSALNDEYYIRSWQDMNHNFFQALKVEKSVMTILLALIILVAVFNIVSSLTMTVMEKTKDIGILRALGAAQSSIRNIFILEGFSIGFFGILLGSAAGLSLAANLNAVSDAIKKLTGFEVFPSDVYYFDKIPTELHVEDVALIVGVALVAAIVAGFYPAHRAASLHPVEALRYE